MFAEDVELLPKDSFTKLLASLPASGEGFEKIMRQLFREMNTGTGKDIFVVLRKKLSHFNGGLFADDTVLPINGLQFGLLKNGAWQNWGNVGSVIFGTLRGKPVRAFAFVSDTSAGGLSGPDQQ